MKLQYASTSLIEGCLLCLPCRSLKLCQNWDIRSPKRLCIEYQSSLAEQNSLASPVKDGLLPKSKLAPPPMQSAFASPTRANPGGGGETCAETAINIIFGKVRENVYCLFQQILNQRTSLFFNCHIDQIILCCFYGVPKISQLNLYFKDILYKYSKQPKSKPQVFRSVFVDWSLACCNGKTGQEHNGIITFYNEIFIPSVMPLLVELGSEGTKKSNQITEINNGHLAQCPGSPKISPFPNLPDMSPKEVSTTDNVYVSPLRSSRCNVHPLCTPLDALMANSSKSYYACVGESTRAYQSPSEDLTAINNRLNGTRKVRGPLNFEEVDVGLVSDTMVASSLCMLSGNCATSLDAPVKS